MSDRFTSEEAFDAADAGEPITMSLKAVYKMLRDHDVSVDDFHAEFPTQDLYNADEILQWLGY